MTRIDNKDKLQQELLAKIKPGVKASDLRKSKLSSLQSKGDNIKKQVKNSQKQPKKAVSPPMAKSDSGYSSNEEPNKSIPTAPPLPNQDLINQISSLKKQLQTYKDFKEADLKIKEKYKQEIAQQEEIIAKYSQAETEAEKVLNQQKKTIAELQAKNSELTKTIQELQNTAKTTAENKPEPIKTFTCADCNQAKPHSELSRIFGNFSFCLDCSKKARHQAQEQKSKPQPLEFICHLCNKPKTEIPFKMKLDSTLQEYLVCLECKPLAKEFNEADLITDELWEKYPYSSASEILEKEFGIVRKS